MPNWKHTLNVKQFFLDYEGTPSSEETTAMAAKVIAEIKNLQEKLSPTEELHYDLDIVSAEFEVIDSNDHDDEAQDQFNFALDELYSCGDYQHRIWVK